MVFQHTKRCSIGDDRGHCPDPGGDSLFHSCRSQPDGGFIRLILHCNRYGICRRKARHDFGGHRGYGSFGRQPRAEPRHRVFVRSHRAGGNPANPHGDAEARQIYHLFAAAGHDRVCERAGDSDLYGAADSFQRTGLGDVCSSGAYAAHNLYRSPVHQGGAFGACGDYSSVRAQYRASSGCENRWRYGRHHLGIARISSPRASIYLGYAADYFAIFPVACRSRTAGIADDRDPH
ncbi:hypothetical protein D3C73_947930 [compost metagenome]